MAVAVVSVQYSWWRNLFIPRVVVFDFLGASF